MVKNAYEKNLQFWEIFFLLKVKRYWKQVLVVAFVMNPTSIILDER